MTSAPVRRPRTDPAPTDPAPTDPAGTDAASTDRVSPDPVSTDLVGTDLVRSAAGLAALAGGAVALHQLLYGWHWFALVLATGALVLGAGVLGRAVRLPAGAVVVGQVVLVALLVTAGFASGAAVAGLLPGPAAVSSLAGTIRTGTDAVNHYAAPAPALAGIELLLVLGTGAAAVVIDLLVTRGLPALTGLVVLALQAVTACCLPAGTDTWSFLLGGAGWLALLLVCGRSGPRRAGALRDRSQPHQPHQSQPHPPRPQPHQSQPYPLLPGQRPELPRDHRPAGIVPVARGLVGRRTALTSLGLAALVPALLPGLRSGRLTRLFSGDGNGTGGGGGGQLLTVRDPLVELRRNLVQPANVEVLVYGTADTTGQYLRLATLDQFDGERWTARPHLPRLRIDDGITAAEGLTATVPRVADTIAFTVASGLSSIYLPVPYPATRVLAEGGWWFSPAGLDVVSYGWRASGGFRYRVSSLELSFDPKALRRAGAPPAAVLGRDLALPPLPPVVESTMRRVVAGATTDFDRAVALQEWFRSSFTYDTSIVDASSTDAVVRFLTSRRGYCEQFAATMALMARQLGIPARVVVGFLPGTQAAETWVVTAHEAHAWPELYFAGAGWVRFEPTPATQSGAEPDWTVGGSAAALNNLQVGGGSDAEPRIVHRTTPQSTGAAATDPGATPAPGRSHLAGVLAGVAAAAVVVVGAPAVVAGASRERRWRRARHSVSDRPTDPPTSGSPAAASVAAAVQSDLVEMAWEYVGGWSPVSTPRQVGERLQRALRSEPAAAAAAGRLVGLVEQLRFAAPGTPVAALDPAGIRRDSDLVRHTLSLHRPWWARARAALLPGGLRRRLLGHRAP